MHFVKKLVLLKDERQECWERKFRRLGWIICIESKEKGVCKRAAEELKHWIKAKAATLKRYKSRVNQYRQNRLLQSNQSNFYKEFDGKSHESNTIPDKEKN